MVEAPSSQWMPVLHRNLRAYFWSYVKLCVALSALAWVVSRIGIAPLQRTLMQLDLSYILAAILLMLLSKIICVWRMQWCLERLFGKIMPYSTGWKIYFAGMSLGLILPGGVSGDAYRLWIFSRIYHLKKLDALRLLLSERFSGLYALGLLLLALLALFETPYHLHLHVPIWGFPIWLVGLFIAGTAGFFLITRMLVREPITVLLGSVCRYALPSQLVLLAAFWMLLAALSPRLLLHADGIGFLILAILASMVASLPISVGGVGLRELTFLYGAPLLGVNDEIGVSLAFLIYLLHVVVGLPGVFYVKIPR